MQQDIEEIKRTLATMTANASYTKERVDSIYSFAAKATWLLFSSVVLSVLGLVIKLHAT